MVADATDRCRLLLVEDHADTREMLARLLSRDYDVTTAECYHTALAVAATAPPHIVIADVGLPGPDGVELMREMRARHGVPGIAVTGYPIGDPESFHAAGFVRCLTKPIVFDDLLAAIASARGAAIGAAANGGAAKG